jgi:toxin secretion/phage lysis holin
MDIKKAQIMIVGIAAVITGFLGNLAIPVYILITCNVIDYITALIAAPKREERIDSLKGFRGLAKKVLMYCLIGIGWMLDILVNYAAATVRPDFAEPYIIAIVVALWLVFNEMLSILENISDAGVPVPAFLKKLVKSLKKKTEDVGNGEEDESDS